MQRSPQVTSIIRNLKRETVECKHDYECECQQFQQVFNERSYSCSIFGKYNLIFYL